jgi:small GTP-binding protein
MRSVQSIKSDISRLKGVAGELNEASLVRSLDDISYKLVYNQFYLVIVGLFKRGKSSLINALLGKEIAPVAVTPLTSVITFFQYGPVTSAEVFFKNGTGVPVDLHDIYLYIAEENNPGNRRDVEYVKINARVPILENLILVDTPGLGSLFSHNTETTLEFLPRIDAALFVLSADVPISKADEEFLVKIRDSISDVIFVLNKTDLLTPDELKKMIGYNQAMLGGIYNVEPGAVDLMPVSAKDYFRLQETGGSGDPGNIGLLTDRINRRIIGSKDEILLSRSVKILLSITDQLGAFLKVKLDTLKLPVEELEKKREAMQESINYLASGKVDFDAVIKNRIRQLIDSVTEQCEQKRKELEQSHYNMLIRDPLLAWEEIRKTDADVYSRELAREIINEYNELKNRLEKSVKDEFSNILLEYSTLSRSFLQEIIRQMKDVLDIDIESIITSFDLEVYTAFYFKTTTRVSVPSIRRNLFYKVLPGKAVRSMVLKQVYRNCIELINPNSGRMRGDIDYKISESYRKFKYHFDNKLYDLLNSLKNQIEESIATRSSLSENINAKSEYLTFQKNLVSEIRQHYSPGTGD